MFVSFSNRYRCLYVAIPKNASSSIAAWLYQLDGLDYHPDRLVHSLGLAPEAIHQRFPGHFLFTCVRNPFTRIVSCYLDKFVFTQFKDGTRKSTENAPAAYRGNLERIQRLEQIAAADAAM